MCIHKHLSKTLVLLTAAVLAAGNVCPLYATENAVAEPKKNKSSFYQDLFDYNVYDEGTAYLHMERLARKTKGKKAPAADVNIYDEVPDSGFFTNRHARKRLSEKELAEGYRETAGPDWSQAPTVLWAEIEDKHLVFYVRDVKGNEYQLRFDNFENFELATSAEVIASRFYYAIGYNVPQCTIEVFPASKLVPDPKAYIYDESGFRGDLTAERLQEALTSMPLDSNGNYRVSACKIPAGADMGHFSFREDRRKGDPQDSILHLERRSIRALRIFASWLNDYGVRASKTLDLYQDKSGQKVMTHYLTGFRSALGAGEDGVKAPEVGYEHLVDYGEVTKSFLTLGLRDPAWHKRWLAEGEKAHPSPAVGYFNNSYFEPEKFKTELPGYAFKDLTRADAFWAAKIIKSFTNEDIQAMVSAGKLSDPKDAEYLTTTLLNRRDLIAKYWFSQASPLDDFNLQGGKLTFVDLGSRWRSGTRKGSSIRLMFASRTAKNSGKSKRLKVPGRPWIYRNS
jgi:hypothetical protein